DTGLANRRLIKLACDPNYPEVYAIFGYWRGEKFTLSAEEMALLLKSENVWIRALTCVTFPDQCGKEWTERLLRDLRESQQPMPDKLFARLLPNLDDDDFAVRQQATEELQRHGERVRTQLAKALQGQPSPEVKDRLKRVLEEIAKEPPRIV